MINTPPTPIQPGILCLRPIPGVFRHGGSPLTFLYITFAQGLLNAPWIERASIKGTTVFRHNPGTDVGTLGTGFPASKKTETIILKNNNYSRLGVETASTYFYFPSAPILAFTASQN